MPERPRPIRFTVPGRPVPWKRRVQTRSGHTYMPRAVTEYKQRVANAFCNERVPPGPFPWPGPVALTIRAEYSVPPSWPKWRRTPDHLRCYPWALVHGDWDNIGKLVSDALNGLAYEDDRQVVNAVVQKVRITGPSNLAVEVRFMDVPPKTRKEAR